MPAAFDEIKKTGRGRTKDQDGNWSELEEFEYSSSVEKIEKPKPRPTVPNSRPVNRSRKKDWFKSVIGWVGKAFVKPRYTLFADKGHTFRLDTITGETWYYYTQREELFAAVQGAPRWKKMLESKLDKPKS